MTVALELRTLINDLHKKADRVIQRAAQTDPSMLNAYVNGIAASLVNLEKLAQEHEQDITPDMLDDLVSLAHALDESADPGLRKKASVLDELLLTIAAPKNAVAQAKKQSMDELNRLREKYRGDQLQFAYQAPKISLDKQNLIEQTRKAVDEKLKKYEVLQAPLQTRYSPDYPGVPTTRVADGVYQDVMTGKVYDYNAGYTTNKGNRIPGSTVAGQIPDLGAAQQMQSLFETRESVMGRTASDNGMSQVFRALKKNSSSRRGGLRKTAAEQRIMLKAFNLLRRALIKIAQAETFLPADQMASLQQHRSGRQHETGAHRGMLPDLDTEEIETALDLEAKPLLGKNVDKDVDNAFELLQKSTEGIMEAAQQVVDEPTAENLAKLRAMYDELDKMRS